MFKRNWKTKDGNPSMQARRFPPKTPSFLLLTLLLQALKTHENTKIKCDNEWWNVRMCPQQASKKGIKSKDSSTPGTKTRQKEWLKIESMLGLAGHRAGTRRKARSSDHSSGEANPSVRVIKMGLLGLAGDRATAWRSARPRDHGSTAPLGHWPSNGLAPSRMTVFQLNLKGS